MLKTIGVSCPACLNLFSNIRGITQDGNPDLKLINQTVNIYDMVYIKETRNIQGTNIISKNKISEELINNILKITNLFFDYTNIKVKGLIIEVEKLNKTKDLNLESSIIAGVLLGLNHYYETNLSKKELMHIAFLIGNDVPYFIVGGCCSITGKGMDIEKLHINPYNNYLIIDSGLNLTKDSYHERISNYPIVKRSSINNIIYNDFTKVMPEELIRIREFLKKYKEYPHSLSGTSSSYFLATEKNTIPANIGIALKREFSNYHLYPCKNTIGHKILVIKK